MKIEMKNFLSYNKKFIKAKKDLFSKALFYLGVEIIARSVPYAPIDEGTLVGSSFVAVKNKKIYYPNKDMQKRKNNVLNHTVKNSNDLVLNVGYATPYAQRLHENKFNPGRTSLQKGLTTTYRYLKRVINKKYDVDLLAKILRKIS